MDLVSLLEYAAASGVGVVLTLVVLYFALPHLFARSLARFEADMARATIEHQTRFAWLHDRRAQALVELSALLADAEEAARFAANMVAASSESMTRASGQAGRSIIALEQHLRRNRVLFDEEVREPAEELRGHLTRIAGAGSFGSSRSDAARVEFVVQAKQVLRERAGPLSDQIDARIRSLLAGKEP